MRRAGFTLIETLVALGLFVIFGGVLALFMRAGTRSWDDRRADAYLGAEAESILDMVARELRGISPADPPEPFDPPPLLFAWYPAGTQETSFLTLPGPEYESSLLHAGNGLDDDGDGETDEEKLNGLDDDGDGETDEDCRRPPTTKPHVVYFTTPPGAATGGRFTLWKGFDFEDSPVGLSAEADFDRRCRVVSTHTAFFEMRFALKGTDTWDASAPPSYPPPDEHRPVGPSLVWNSLRSLLNIEEDPFENFEYLDPAAGPDEQVLPERVLLVIGMLEDDEPYARLQQTIGRSDDVIALDTAEGLSTAAADGEAADLFQVLLIEDEWVVYDAVDGNYVHLYRRGAKGSEAVDHFSGAEVYRPKVFVRKIFLPAGNTPW